MSCGRQCDEHILHWNKQCKNLILANFNIVTPLISHETVHIYDIIMPIFEIILNLIYFTKC